ncbi:MAG: formylglycine-generating enzyme family protein [Desulfobacula sp.]|nr:formylglycine-generating enzyme family protein [Desulfobacula sp.]
MANISISLEGIDQAIVNLKYRPGSVKQRAISAIRSFYETDESVKELDSINTDDLIQSIWDVGDNLPKIKSRRRNFSSVKSSINVDLEKLSKKGMNAENIIISDSNLFDMSEEAKNNLLNSFTDAVKTGDIDLDQATVLLKTVTDFLENIKLDDTQTDNSDIINQIKKILNKITEDVLSEEELEGTQGLRKLKQGDIPFEDEDFFEDDDEIEEIEFDKDEEFEELEEIEEDELLDDDVEEIELDEDQELEEIEDYDQEDGFDQNEDIEEIELDEDEELEEIEEDELLDDDVEEIELDEDQELEEIEDLNDESFEEDDGVEDIEIDEDQDLEEVEDDGLIDEDIEEIDLDEDEDIEEIELDEDEALEELEEVEEDLLDDDVDEMELDEDEDVEEIDELDEEELKALEEFREKRLLAEHFDNTLGEREKKFNQYVTVPHGMYTIGTRKGIKASLELQQFEMPKVYIGVYPVTNAFFEIFIEETGFTTTAEKSGVGRVYTSRFRKNGKEAAWSKNAGSRDIEGANWFQPKGPGSTLHGKRNHPVVQVSVDDAMAFASWIGRRIPTEAEWESAARTDLGYKYPWGNEFNQDALNIEKSGICDTSSVDEYDPFSNEFKIADMLGNVLEWTSNMEYPSIKTSQKAKLCIAKGAAWNAKDDVTISSRALFKSGFTSNIVGFRCISEILF